MRRRRVRHDYEYNARCVTSRTHAFLPPQGCRRRELGLGYVMCRDSRENSRVGRPAGKPETLLEHSSHTLMLIE